MKKILPLTLQLSARDVANRSADFVASTSAPVLTRELVGEGEEREFLDSIVDWDLSRFESNPVVPFVHNTQELPIGTVESGSFENGELRVRIKFATERANPFAEQVWRAFEEGIVRGVSVGFDRETLSEEERDGKTFRNLKGFLHEISIVPVPADENGLPESISRQRQERMAQMLPDGTSGEEETEEERRRKLSDAAKALSAARKPRVKTDLSDDTPAPELRLDAGSRLDSSKVEILTAPVGGIRVPVRIARTGILNYRKPDGTTRREYRPLEEVSKAESLRSFEGAPIIDFVDHTKLITTEDFRGKTVGHVANIRMDGEYVIADAYINDATTIEMIDRGERLDTSAGYVTKDDHTPGTWRGEAYDLIQRNIVGNHVALCPPNRGRSGPDVGLRLDSQQTTAPWCALIETQKEIVMKVIKLDGKELEFGSEAHIEKIEELHRAEVTKLTSEKDELRAKLDAADDEKSKREKAEEEKAKREEEEKAEQAKRVKARMKRALRAARIMEEDDEEKMDALLDKDDREIMIAAIKHVDEKFDKLNESDDYIRARFDSLEAPAGSSTGVASVVTEIESRRKLDAAESDDEVTKARNEMIERQRNAWKSK